MPLPLPRFGLLGKDILIPSLPRLFLLLGGDPGKGVGPLRTRLPVVISLIGPTPLPLPRLGLLGKSISVPSLPRLVLPLGGDPGNGVGFFRLRARVGAFIVLTSFYIISKCGASINGLRPSDLRRSTYAFIASSAVPEYVLMSPSDHAAPHLIAHVLRLAASAIASQMSS